MQDVSIKSKPFEVAGIQIDHKGRTQDFCTQDFNNNVLKFPSV